MKTSICCRISCISFDLMLFKICEALPCYGQMYCLPLSTLALSTATLPTFGYLLEKEFLIFNRVFFKRGGQMRKRVTRLTAVYEHLQRGTFSDCVAGT